MKELNSVKLLLFFNHLMVFCCSCSAATFSAILRSKRNMVLITTLSHGFFDGNR